uniref:Uncharacterized protein n=1 Tax=Arundo donax TaxID=35708 RepID=A0A0A9GLI0_ARUDO
MRRYMSSIPWRASTVSLLTSSTMAAWWTFSAGRGLFLVLMNSLALCPLSQTWQFLGPC